jgi:hypothetical protein
MHTTSRALAFASRWFDAATVDRVFEPLIADWQREWHDATGLSRWSVSIRGMAAFLCAALVSSHRILRQPTPATVANRIVTRIAWFTLVPTVLLTLPYVWEMESVGPGLLFLIPSALALVFPFAMVAAVDAIRCDHALPPHVERATAVKLAVASLVFMFVFGGFVLPASNQAFRVTTFTQSLRAQGMDEARIARINPGRDTPRRGLRELSTYELLTNHGFNDGTRYLPDTINRELSNRASLAVLPTFLLWLRWRLLDLPRRRWSPLPPTVVAVTAFVAFGVLRQSDVIVEGGLGLSPGSGAWSPLVVIGLALFADSLRRTKRARVA